MVIDVQERLFNSMEYDIGVIVVRTSNTCGNGKRVSIPSW